jgi:hypothetical protein
MYDAFWNNVSRAENAAWTMIAVYGALIAGIGLAQPLVTTVGAAFFLIVFGYIGSCLAASANTWYRRNLTLIGRVETKFLKAADYGSLIPLAFAKHRRFWTAEYWAFLIFAYPVISVCASLILLASTNTQNVLSIAGIHIRGGDLIWLTILTGLIVTAIYVAAQDHSYHTFLEETTA